MITCNRPLDSSPWVDLPGPPLVEVDCPTCRGAGAHLSAHPLYAGAEPCADCCESGAWLVEHQGDTA